MPRTLLSHFVFLEPNKNNSLFDIVVSTSPLKSLILKICTIFLILCARYFTLKFLFFRSLIFHRVIHAPLITSFSTYSTAAINLLLFLHISTTLFGSSFTKISNPTILLPFSNHRSSYVFHQLIEFLGLFSIFRVNSEFPFFFFSTVHSLVLLFHINIRCSYFQTLCQVNFSIFFVFLRFFAPLESFTSQI